MTREKAILHMTLRRAELEYSVSDLDEDIKAFDMAIKALKQEPCEDAINRQSVLDKWENTTLRGRTEFDQVIMMLPSVAPQSKIGHWIRQQTPYGLADTCECSLCGRTIYAKDEEDLEDYPYCHCGARMEGE